MDHLFHPSILSVLIVDDEAPLRAELRNYSWETLNAVLVGEAENGLQALQQCREYNPDVVVTDITMPGMDGLALIRQLQIEFPDIEVVVLTCHSEFSYAREALRLGAVDYVIKVAIDEGELQRAMNKVWERVEKKQFYRLGVIEEERWKQFRVFGQLFQQYGDNGALFNELMKNAGFYAALPNRLIRLCIRAKPDDKLLVHREIQLALVQWEKELSFPYVCIPVKMGQFMLISQDSVADDSELVKLLSRFLWLLQELMNEQFPYVSSEMKIFGLIEGYVTCVEDLPLALAGTEALQHQLFYTEDSPVLFANQLILRSVRREEAADYVRKTQELSKHAPELANWLEKDFFEWARAEKIHPEELVSLILRMSQVWNPVSSSRSVVEQQTKLTRQLLNASSISVLIDVTMRNFHESVSRSSNIHPEIGKAMELIHTRYAELLSLTAVAKEIGLSPHYLSRLFHAEVGKSFNEYLSLYRVEQAKILLQEPGVRVYEVAERVGIPNYRYFSLLFKKITHVAPTHYKKG